MLDEPALTPCLRCSSQTPLATARDARSTFSALHARSSRHSTRSVRYLSNGAESFDALSSWLTGCAAPTFLDRNLKNSRHDLIQSQVGALLCLRSEPQRWRRQRSDPTRRSHPSLWTQACARAPLETTLQPSAAVRGRRGQMYGRMPE